MYATLIHKSFDFRAAITTFLQQLEQVAAQLEMVVFVGTANTYSDLDDKANSRLVEHPEAIANSRIRHLNNKEIINYTQAQF
jgi:hypothetical protein